MGVGPRRRPFTGLSGTETGRSQVSASATSTPRNSGPRTSVSSSADTGLSSLCPPRESPPTGPGPFPPSLGLSLVASRWCRSPSLSLSPSTFLPVFLHLCLSVSVGISNRLTVSCCPCSLFSLNLSVSLFPSVFLCTCPSLSLFVHSSLGLALSPPLL